MNREEYLKFHEEFCKKMYKITEAKNHDYAGVDDTFRNFRMVEELGVASAEQGFLTRMTDKLSRLATFVRGHELKVKDESVQDTIMDLANYCILFAGYLKSDHYLRNI